MLKDNHKFLVEESLRTDRQVRAEKWTESLAVGSKEFVEGVKSSLSVRAQGRTARQVEEAYQLREPLFSYNGHLGAGNDDIGWKNTYIWDKND